MKVTKRQLQRIIAEEKQKLTENRDELKDFRITLTVRVPARSVEYVLNSIEDGMEFDEEIGEGILHYDVQEVARVAPPKTIKEGASGHDIESSIQKALEINGVMSGIDLIDYVMDDIPGHVYHQRVADYMDEMLDDGVLTWDIKEDEWRLA